MADHPAAAAAAASELFRYARLRSPLIVDVRKRADGDDELRSVMAKEVHEREAWARKYLDTREFAVRTLADLRSPDLAALDERELARSGPRLPGPVRSAAATPEERQSWQDDRTRCLRTLVAHMVLGDRDQARWAARRLQLVESLGAGAARLPLLRWADPVLQRHRPKAVDVTPPEADEGEPEDPGVELRRLRDGIVHLWHARVAVASRRRNELLNRHRLLRRSGVQGQRGVALEQLRQQRDELVRDRRKLRDRDDIGFGLIETVKGSHEDLLTPGIDPQHLKQVHADARDLVRRHRISAKDFCEAFQQVSEELDTVDQRPAKGKVAGKGCFAEHPDILAAPQVRLLGCADLIKVEQTFLGYREGEISYVENVLAGELRRREVVDTREVEQIEQTTTEEVAESTREQSATTSSELSTQIESELRTRLNSDVNASGSVSGGGSIGMVELEGSGSLSAGLGVDIDSAVSSRSETNFAQEIVAKAVEKTRKAVTVQRTQRVLTSRRSTNHHEIDNRSASPQHRRGVYCFLDKEVCVSESIYGKRLFLLAELPVPGRNLVCEQRLRIAEALEEIGERPRFDLSPEDVQPGNYLSLVGRYRAQNVQPPPEAVLRLARTYKTDAMNANAEGGGFDLERVTKMLVPFFARYKRFLITDTLQVPDGYEVQDVWVTVNHGANGLSIPAHLPLALAGASVVSAPTLLYAAVLPWLYMPLAVWQLSTLASPLLHYNSDSSNVTVCVGNESQDSPYYFFDPDLLVALVFDVLGNLGTLGPGLVETLQTEANTLFETLSANAAALPQGIADAVEALVATVLSRVHTVFQKMREAIDPGQGSNDPIKELEAIGESMTDLVKTASMGIGSLQLSMNDLFAPLQTFFTNVFDKIREAFDAALSDFFGLLLDLTDSSQMLKFADCFGCRKELAFSIDAVALQPGIAVNLSACLRRTDRALDLWRLETFARLHQAYLQQVADHESRAFELERHGEGTGRSPGTLRREEHAAVKELALHALNNLHGAPGAQYDMQRIRLFEHAVDWANMSYRLYTYGPSRERLALERARIFQGADEKRRAFLTAHWSQVLLPLQPDPRLEQALLAYLESGVADLEQEVQDDELAALYQNLVLERQASEEVPVVLSRRRQWLPTDLVVLKLDDALPSSGIDCTSV